MGAMINVSLLKEGGSYAALSSAVDGNGKIVLCKKADADLNEIMTLNLSDDLESKVIGFMEVSSHIYGIAAGGNLGYGGELFKWSFDGNIEKRVLLDHSDTISGHDPLSYSNESLFKFRAIHHVMYQEEGQTTPQSVVRVLVHNSSLSIEQEGLIGAWDIETGEFLNDKCLKLSWANKKNDEQDDIKNQNKTQMEREENKLRDDRKRFGGISCAFYHEIKTKQKKDPTQIINPNNSSSEANHNPTVDNTNQVFDEMDNSKIKRFIITGHLRNEVGDVKVHVWDADSGTLEATLMGPNLPIDTFSTAGVLQVSMSNDWIIASCADGRIHCWDRITLNKVAVLTSEGVLVSLSNQAPAPASASSAASSSSHRPVTIDHDMIPIETRRLFPICSAFALSTNGYLIVAYNAAKTKKTTSIKETSLQLFQLKKLSSSTSSTSTSSSLSAAEEVTSENDRDSLMVKHCGALPSLSSMMLPSTRSNGQGIGGGEVAVEGNENHNVLANDIILNENNNNEHDTKYKFGKDLKINKIVLDLERRGKIVVACSCLDSNINGVEMNGFLAEYDFLKV
eukprot:CAMPEP_0114356292 /NCGR_PEP_ID=MMETSP0101-20121206/20854_1 /TAXON_ID=38822 ORGANISM="Pteridomonas danica, Strain PT" /NCGR_SAMPLE_ID=MMETSP0101 /ASSEMBLY_ACC=CAM_ASM_000211 /LENGTH=565 /DNA_ID=CAMNT_0001498655 /DNA_START=155 /DNA_END=1852 /DNA_ORIENTATION=+